MNSVFQIVPQYPKAENVWTPAENKQFEVALALHDKDTPDRWIKVAGMIPGKTVDDVMKQYNILLKDVNDIEDGLIPIPCYVNCSFTLEWMGSQDIDGFKRHNGVTGKRSASHRAIEHERKKGVPWTEDEHKRFLEGLANFGKGDWRNISRIHVISRTPTQVASHAQKFYIRQSSTGKDKRRSSIHDITTFNSTDCKSKLPSFVETQPTDLSSIAMQPLEQYPYVDSIGIGRSLVDQEMQNQGHMMVFGSLNENVQGYQQIGHYDSTFQMQFQVGNLDEVHKPPPQNHFSLQRLPLGCPDS